MLSQVYVHPGRQTQLSHVKFWKKGNRLSARSVEQQVGCWGLFIVEIYCKVHWFKKGSYFHLFCQNLLQNNFPFRYKCHLSWTVGEKLQLTKHVTYSTWKPETSFCVLRSACQICVSWRNLEERLFRRTTKLSLTATCYWRFQRQGTIRLNLTTFMSWQRGDRNGVLLFTIVHLMVFKRNSTEIVWNVWNLVGFQSL